MIRKSLMITLLTFTLLIMSSLGAGCDRKTNDNLTNQPPLPPVQQKDMVNTEITLYFGDDQAMYLIPERRIVRVEENIKDSKLIEVIVKELIAGPKESHLRPTIPPEAKLLSVEINNKIAYIDFTDEMRTKHWGGSAGETMTITSLVNSVTELGNIEKVQFLIEGEIPDSLIGHWFTGEPIERNEEIINK